MSYLRLYPNKNNTLFRYSTYADNAITSNFKFEDINCGANPVMELMDGKGESKLIWEFYLPQSLIQKLSLYSFTCNLQLWDAGTLWEPPIKLKDVKLDFFENDWSEGDGYSFLSPEAKAGYSNWNNATSSILWSDVTFTNIQTIALNRINEDLTFDLTEFVSTKLDKPEDRYFSFALSIDNREDSPTNIYRKFIHSGYTKTVFKPYLEIIIDDVIKDKTYNTYATLDNKYYLINKAGNSFTGAVSCDVTINGNKTTYTGIEEKPGIYYVSVTSLLYSSVFRKEIMTMEWMIGEQIIAKQLVELKSPDIIQDEYDYSKLYFYTTCPSTHNIVKQGDILPINVISEIRGKGTIVVDSYEYRVTSMDGFEMIPWLPVSVYRDKMYFNINTNYFFPEQEYEIWLRNNTNNFILTSSLTTKFKVAMNDKSHLREITSSPYYSRNQNFSK